MNRTKPKTKQQPKSLLDFIRAKKRASCSVCRLPEAIHQQIASARTKKIPRSQWLEWLATEMGVRLTSADFDAHFSGKHDQ